MPKKGETPIVIVEAGKPVLRRKAAALDRRFIASEEVQELIGVMSTLLGETINGVALAAPQVGRALRLFIIDAAQLLPRQETASPARAHGPYLVYINPVILKTSKRMAPMSEGCLSVKDVYGLVRRHEKLIVEAFDERGQKFRRGASGLLAQIIQHEVDHLDGLLFTDKATDLVRAEKEK